MSLTFFCGAGGCVVEDRNEESEATARYLTYRWARDVEGEIRALTGLTLRFPDVDRQAMYYEEAYEAAERHRVMRATPVATTLQMQLFEC